MRRLSLIAVAMVPLEALAQFGDAGGLGPLDLARLRNFSAYRASSNNLYVDSNDDSKHPIPGETVVLADLQGPGVVTHIWITVADSEYGWPRLARLRVYYDGRKTPSVDVPLGDFFGVGHGYERNLNSQMVRNSSFGRARNCYWPMPFRKSCRITVTNEGKRRMTSLYYHVDWQKHESLPEDIGYLHASYRQANPPAPGKNYTILETRGRGQYVGTVLSVIQTEVGWFGEGDELFYVDGESAPRIEGTGSEDYFNDAWALRVSDGAWTGIPVAEGEGVGARLTGYRWHVPDVIPFTKSLRVEIEHKGWTYNADGTARSGFEERPDLFSSVAFWYQQGVNESLPEPPYGDARLPFGNAQQIEVENSLAAVTTEKGEASVQKEVFWSKDLLFFRAQGVGSRLNVPFDVPRDGRYEVVAQVAQAPDYGDYIATLDGKPTSSTTLTWGPLDVFPTRSEVLRNYQSEIYVAHDRRLGWFDLTKGRHVLTLVCVGRDIQSSGYNFGIDTVVLAEVGSPPPDSASQSPGVVLRAESEQHAGVPREPVYRGRSLDSYLGTLRQLKTGRRIELIRFIGAFGEGGAAATRSLVEALSDPDPEVRRAAALSLSQIGAKGAAAVSKLADTLKDRDTQVREASALALREMAPAAQAAIPELCVALKDPAATVRMAAATALGKMGELAKDAVPVLAAVLQVPGEEVQVLRNEVNALADIGSGARAAVPVLRQIQHLRVKYIAEEAVAKIEGRPVPTWH